jgi:hypothetical protein
LAGHEFGWDLAVDRDSSQIYWSYVNRARGGLVRRAGFDGTGFTDLVDVSIGEPLGVALDAPNATMYLGGDAPAQVMRANLSTVTAERLFLVASPPAAKVGDVAFDPVSSTIYYAEFGTGPGSGAIRRANVDGSSMVTLVSGLSDPTGLSLDFAGGHMYWADRFHGSVQRAALDGSMIQTLVPAGAGARSVALDLRNGHLLWSTTNSMVRSDLDGGNPVPLPLPLGGANGMIVVDYVPEPSLTYSLSAAALVSSRRHRRRRRHANETA